jgi:hypothetical protein
MYKICKIIQTYRDKVIVSIGRGGAPHHARWGGCPSYCRTLDAAGQGLARIGARLQPQAGIFLPHLKFWASSATEYRDCKPACQSDRSLRGGRALLDHL